MKTPSGPLLTPVLYSEVPAGAPEDEKDVLVEVKSVCRALKESGFAPVRMPLTPDLSRLEMRLHARRLFKAFNLVESMQGSCRLLPVVPSFLEKFNVPFTGSGSETLYVTTNKPLSKSIMKLGNIPTPAWQTCEEAFRHGVCFAPPYIVKSIWEHASIGLDENSIHTTKHSLAKALQAMDKKTRAAFFFEAYVDGREFNISVLDINGRLNIMPPAEIKFEGFGRKPKIVDYRAKWDENSYQYRHTNRTFDIPSRDSGLLRRVGALTLRCCEAFDIHGYARVDFRIDKHNRPFVLEVNANPCISPDSGFIAACGQSGLSYNEIIVKIISA
jgi:D-alanine-D-alanine ligase